MTQLVPLLCSEQFIYMESHTSQYRPQRKVFQVICEKFLEKKINRIADKSQEHLQDKGSTFVGGREV